MMTQTHILVSSFLLAKKSNWRSGLLAVAGGIVPDAALFVLYAVEKFKGTAEKTIWGEVYWQPFWQDVVAIGNSIPLYLSLALVGVIGRWSASGRAKVASDCLLIFAVSCLIHVGCDFPVHHDDAHRHLFPVSNYKFISPVSYWDPRHFGVPMSICEAIVGAMLAGALWRRSSSGWVKAAVGLLGLTYVLLPAYFAYRYFTCGGVVS